MTWLRIGTRGSALARRQALTVKAAFQSLNPHLRIAVVELSTAGDEQPDAPLERLEGTGWFTSTLERALAADRIDVAVHSYKDLPVAETPEFLVAATLPRGPAEDVLCAGSREARLANLRPGARVGTSSLRRLAQLRRLRSDLTYLPLRGNVTTRLDRVSQGDLDAVVLARAGVERLGLEERVVEVFPITRVLPAPGQGALAVQTRAADPDPIRLARALDHPPSHGAVRAEREVLRILHGGCSVPVGAYAEPLGPDRFRLRAGVFALGGEEAAEVDLEGSDPVGLGAQAAAQLLIRGAAAILDRARCGAPHAAA